MADFVSKATAKTAETAASTLAGAALGSIVPGIGTAAGAIVGGVVGGMGSEALISWLRGFLSKSEVDLVLDPVKELTEEFLREIRGAASKQRIVLILDTYERLIGLDDWVCDLIRRLDSNVLVVISGRLVPNWGNQWPTWLAHSDIRELEPMSPEVMRELVRRYCATQLGEEPDAVQVDAIIRFGRGLPIAVTSAVRLWVLYKHRYKVHDFEQIKPQVGADLVDRLMQGVPQELRSALEAAAIVRWFNRDILALLLGIEDVGKLYDEIRAFPFVISRSEGLALHDVVREVIDESLELQSPDRHRTLHRVAAGYFDNDAARFNNEYPERARLEWLYHSFRADERAAVPIFQALAEQLTEYLFVSRLRTLMNEVSTYPLRNSGSSLWRDYYNARLLHISRRYSEAAPIYRAIADDKNADLQLQAYVHADLASM